MRPSLDPFPPLDLLALLTAWLVVVSATFVGYGLFALCRAGLLWLFA